MPAWHCGRVLRPILMQFDRIWSGGQRLCTIYCQVVNKKSCFKVEKFYTIKVFPRGHLGPRTLRPLILRPPWDLEFLCFYNHFTPIIPCQLIRLTVMQFDRIWLMFMSYKQQSCEQKQLLTY